MSAVVQELGEYLYRYKGILSIDGVDKRIVFQGVHTLFAASYDREWQEGEKRVSEVVFIGKDINKEWFQEHFGECEISLRQLQAYFLYEHSIEIVLDFNNETHKGKKRKIENKH